MMHGHGAFAIIELRRGPQEICGQSHPMKERSEENGSLFEIREGRSGRESAASETIPSAAEGADEV